VTNNFIKLQRLFTISIDVFGRLCLIETRKNFHIHLVVLKKQTYITV